MCTRVIIVLTFIEFEQFLEFVFGRSQFADLQICRAVYLNWKGSSNLLKYSEILVLGFDWNTKDICIGLYGGFILFK